MELTKEEFCLFNIKSKLQLVENHGKLIKQRISSEKYVISLYQLYQFYIEKTFDLDQKETLLITPIINPSIIRLYPS